MCRWMSEEVGKKDTPRAQRPCFMYEQTLCQIGVSPNADAMNGEPATTWMSVAKARTVSTAAGCTHPT